jgi:malonyl-CoA/methylmalonyl-CoA synthetase
LKYNVEAGGIFLYRLVVKGRLISKRRRILVNISHKGEILMANFYQALEHSFASNFLADALRLADGTVWRYQHLQERVNDIARALVAEGLQPADRLVVQVEKSAENLALYLACLKVGGVYVPLNTAYTQTEVDYFINDAQPALFVGQIERSDVQTFTMDDHGQGTLLERVAAHSANPVPATATRQPDDMAAILYTSGTTGRSKGAMLSHANLASNAHSLSTCWGWQKDDVLLHALPIFHVHGLFIASHCALLNATPMIFLAKFDAAQVLELLPKATVLMGVPTFYTRLLQQAGLNHASVASIRVFICGSAPLTEQTFNAWEAATGQRILERYGMIETIINTSNPLVGERMAGTVGFALPAQEFRIADADGVPVQNGEIGTIEVRGPNVFQGYWQMPEKTAEEIRDDGFFITGDLGTQDADGRLSIVGRAKDLVISGGYNVYPKEIEGCIDKIPGVSESAVIGVPHADFGEAVVAVIVPSAEHVDIATIQAHLADTLARFKQPKIVVNVDALPRNTMGKVQKNILRDQYAELFSPS